VLDGLIHVFDRIGEVLGVGSLSSPIGKDDRK
jgi:hypothetical protein